MSSIYKNNGIYYLQVTRNRRRITRSLKTSSFRVAKQRARAIEKEMLDDLFNPNVAKYLSFSELCAKYLSADHKWTDTSRETVEWVLNGYQKTRRLPTVPATRVTWQGRLNTLLNWAEKNNYKTNVNKFVLNKMPARKRVFTDKEMLNIMSKTSDKKFNDFVHFAYYTGARRGELHELDSNKIYDNHIEVTGKTGVRIVKINKQAKKILDKYIGKLWSYEPDYITKHFKKNLRRMDIPNGRFHDLRRTFGFNLIRRGMPIYEVSKLLGHKSVTTTERHYAPLLVSDVRDFIL